MLDELQDNSYLSSLRDLVVSEARAAGASQLYVPVCYPAGHKDHNWGRKESAEKRQHWVGGILPQNEARVSWSHLLNSQGNRGCDCSQERQYLLVLGSNISARGRDERHSALSAPTQERLLTALHCTSTVLALWPPTINPSKTFVNIFWHTALQTSKSEHICKVINFLTNCLDLLL